MAISKSTSDVYVLKSEEPEKGISKSTSGTVKNSGNILEYVGGNIGLGAFGMLEGTFDYTVGLANSLVGDKAYAKYIMQHDITGGLTQKLNDNMNPGKVMQYAGEVGQGIGQSAIFLLNNLGAGPIGTILFAAGAAGRATAEAQNTTGKLGVKEYAYGAVDSAKEMALEWLSGQTFTGLNKTKYSLSKGLSNLLGKTSKEAANVATRRGVIKTMISEGASEFFEEFLGSYIETHNKHVMLNDPNAEYSLSEALYSGLVGFGSGSIMSGVSGTVRAATSHARGSKIVSEGKTGQVLKNAQIVKEFFKDQKWSDWADSESITRVYHDLVASYEAYSKLSADQVTSDKAMVYLGEMEINSAQLECLAEVGGEGEIVKQHAQKYADFASKFFNETITEEDVKNNKNGIANNIALMRWVGYFDNEETVLDAKNQWVRDTIEKNSKKGAEAAQNVAGSDMGNNTAKAPEGSTEGPSYVKTGVTPGGIEYSENSLYNLSTRVYDLGEGRSVVAFQKPGDNGKIGWSLDIGEGTSMVDGNGDSVGYSEVLDDDKIDSIVDDIKKNYDTIMDDAETRKEQKEAETEKKSGEKKTEKKTKKKLKIGNDTVQLATEEDLKKAKIIGDQYKEVTDKLTISQKAQALLLNKMFEGTKYKVLLYSGAGNKGITGAYHGNTIYVDVNSKMLRVTAHELVHSFVKQSPEQYEALKSFVIKSLYEGDEAKLTEAAQEIIDSYKKTGQKLSKEAATEEIVAKSCEEVFGSSKIIKQMLKTDSKLFDAVLTFLDGWQHMIDAAIANYGESNQYLKRMNENAETIKEVRRLFADALKTTYKNQLGDNGSKQEKNIAKAMEEDTELGAGEAQRTDSGEMILAESADGSEVFLSYETYNEYGRKRLAQLLKDQGYSKEEVEAAMKPIEAASKYIGKLAKEFSAEGYDALQEHFYASVERDYRGRQILHALVKNGDYPVNIDLSTICKKRVAYTKLLLRLMDSGIFGKVSYDGEAIARVNEILRKYGFETACMGCFVESRRLQIQAWAEGFAAKWNEAAEKLNPGCKYFDWSTRRDNVLMTEEEVLKLETELSEQKKNDKGNVNLGQGSVETKIEKLMKKVPGLQQKIDATSLLDPAGLKAMRGYAGGSNIYSLLLQNYGAATPKIVQEYNAYNSEIADLTFKFAQETTGESVTGADAYKRAAAKQLKDSKPKNPGKKAKAEKIEAYNAAKAKWDARVEEEAVRNYLFAVGGVRIQSFSDFMIENVFDYYQILTDLAVRGLPMHGYTKEITAMRLFGLSGIKWNGSLIATVSKGMYADADTDKRFAGLIPEAEYEKLKVEGKIPKGLEALKVTGRDGKTYYIGFDDVARNQATKGKTFIQSIGLKDVMALILDKRYSKNCGNITIGISDEQIIAMLRSPYFRMVIPYHKSGMLPEYAALVGVDMYNDYEKYQETKVEKLYDAANNLIAYRENGKYYDADGNEAGEELKDLIKKVPTHFDFNEAANRLGDAKAAADEYLAWCADRNNHVIRDVHRKILYVADCSAKFSNSPYGYDFTKEPNYYKLLEDFNEYDLLDELSDKKTAALQDSARMILPGQDGTKLSAAELKEYAQRLRDTGIFTEEEIKKYVERANWTDEQIIRHELEGRAKYTKQTDGKFELAYKETYGMLMERERTGDAITYEDYKDRNDVAKKARKKGLHDYGVNPPKGVYRITAEDAFKLSFEEIDDEYDQAVKENDGEKLDALVEGAAKKAGYKSPKLFHGTTRFGFKKFIKEALDDKFSIFVTNSRDVAKTYTDNIYTDAWDEDKTKTEIGTSKDPEKIKNMTSEELLHEVNTNEEVFGMMGQPTYAPIDEAETQREIREATERIRTISERYNNPQTIATFNEFINADTAEKASEAFGHLRNYVWSTVKLDKSGYNYDKIWSDYWTIMYKYEGRRYKLINGSGIAEITDKKIRDRLMNMNGNGIYSLYGKTENMFEIDAAGNQWNRIHGSNIGKRGYVNTREVSEYAKNKGISGVIIKDVADTNDSSDTISDVYIFFNPADLKSADRITFDDAGNVIPLSERFNDKTDDLRYSYEGSGYAPTFYSQMSNVISGIKQDKIGAASVVNYLKGKGVKDEEIKWSGIETFLEGKKSVTKKDLQEFAAGSMLQIDEIEMSEMSAYELDDKLYEYTGNMQATDYIDDTDETLDTGWIIDDLKDLLSEGDITQEQYDELVELTHKAATRWHGYRTDSGDYYKELLFKLPNSDYSNYAMRNHWGEIGILAHARIQDMKTDDGGLMLFIEEIQSDWHNAGKKWGYKNKEDAFELREDGDRFVLYKNGEKTLNWDYKKRYAIEDENYNPTGEYDTKKALDYLKSNFGSGTDPVPNAPFKDTYTDYVIKRLLRSAAAQGYDSIGWTTADMQSERWSDDYAEGYRIEYDQDIPKFLNKYGKKWGGKVDKAEIGSGDTIWRFVIPEAMKKSVLYEGQPLYSYEDSDGNKLSKGQQEFFKDSKVRDAQGRLVKVYHGTRNSFTVFDKSLRGTNTNTKVSGQWFFAADKDTANSYYPYGVMSELQKRFPNNKGFDPERLKNKGNLYEMYLNIKNPLIKDVKDYDYEAHRDNKDAWSEFLQEAEENGNDGVILLNALDNQLKTGARESTVYMFRDSNQAKLTTNLNPTSDNDIRYSQEDAISKQLNSGDEENFIYVKNDAKTGRSFIDLILDGKKKGETRNHKRLTRKWVGISDGKKVYGRVRLGDPIEITNKSPEYKDAYIKGTEYDIKDGESKYYYPILEREDFRDNPRDIQKHGNYGKYRYSYEDSEYLELAKDPEKNALRLYQLVTKAAFRNGWIPVKRYHQTDKSFTKFDNSNPDAGKNDSETPNGYFFKTNNKDIGVGGDFVKTGHGGNIQMGVYLKHNNLLHFKDRYEATEWYRENVNGYSELDDKLVAIHNKYDEISDQNNTEFFDKAKLIDDNDPDFEKKAEELLEKYNNLLDEKTKDLDEQETAIRGQLREILNRYFYSDENTYDGIELDYDGHRYINKERVDVHTFIVFDPAQIKSADLVTYDDAGNVIPLSERFNQDNEDIRYSLEDSASITEDRLDYLIDDSGAGSRKDYAQKWITSIDPGEFLKMTLLKKNQDRSVFDNMPGEYGSTVNDRDFIQDLKRSMRQTPYLEIDVDTGDVIGHEGRHRMRALEKAGIKKADIALMFYKDGSLVKDYNKVKNELQSIESLTINNQRGTGQQTVVENIIPINQANKEKIIENYAQKDAGIRYDYEGHKGNGYDGYSMSNNARDAYENGEKPLSRWTKPEIVKAVSEINPNIDLSKVNVETLKDKFLSRSSWHHTSKYYNQTDFYKVKEYFVSKLTQDEVDRIVSEQVSTSKPKRDTSVDKLVDEAYFKTLAIVNSGLLKTENGAINRVINGNDIDDLYQKAAAIIKERDAHKVNSWRGLPADHWNQEYVNLYDNNIDEYIRKFYANRKLSKNSAAFKKLADYFKSISVSDGVKHSYEDSDGNKLSEGQREFFKDSKVRDRNGRLKKVYHSTDASFTKFDIGFASPGHYGIGFYFTPYEEISKGYGKNTAAYYINIKKPFEYYAVKKEEMIDILDNSGYDYDKEFVENYDFSQVEEWGDLIDGFLYDAYPNYNIYDIFSEILKKSGYDGIEVGNEEIIAFYPNQIKLTDNLNPTEDEDINYDFVDEDKKITKEMEAARKLLPSFDENNWNTKRSILEFLRSAEGTKADKDTLSAISSIISVSPDLDVRFIDGAESGSIHRSETGDTLILLDKGLDSAQAIRRTLSAEIIHMSENTETYGKFARLVLGSATEEDQNAVKEKYTKYWKDKGIEITDEALLKECISELGADMLRDRDLVAQWSKKNKALPVRLAEAAKDLARKLFGKNRDAYKEASRLSSILQSAVVENSIRKATGTPGVQWSLGKRPENQSKTRQEILDEARELHFFTRPKSKQKILDLVKQHMAGYFDSTSGSNLANTFVRDLTLPQPTIEIPADASVKVKGMDRISDMLYQAYYNTGSPRAARKAAEAISKAIMESTYIDGSNILIKDVLNERSRTLATITEKAMADKLYESINGGEAYSHLEDIKNKYDNLMQKIRRESNTREQELRDDIARAKGIMKDTLMALEQIRRATNQIKSPSKFKGILASPQMETLTKVISSAKSRGGFLINENVRGAIQAYVDFFANQDNQRGMSEEAELMGIKKEAARETYEACLEAIKNFPVSGENAMGEVLTDAEIETFTDVARTVAQLYRTYNKYYDAKRKEWIDADAVADQGITNTLKMKKLHEGDKKLVKAFKQLWDRYGIEALDPMAAGRLLDGYNENGVMASMMSDIVEAENAKELRIQKYMKPVDDFISEHKDFEKHLTSEEDKVEFRGQKLTRDEFIQLYMTTFRKQALYHFGFGRMEFGTREGRDGLRIIEPALQVDKDWSSYMKEEGLSIEDFQQDCEKVLVEVRDLGNKVLTKEDREYIKLMENFYNNVSTQDKKKMDMTYFGMTNVIEDETDMYVPIKTSMSSRASSVTDERNAMANFTTLSGQGFNKNTVKGAKNPMVFTGAYSLMKEHANGLAAYVELYAAMQKLDRVWSTDVNHNPQNSSRLRDVLSDTYGDNVEKYVRSLMGDIQGINTKKPNAWNPVIGRMRSNYAIFQLGANPKTWFNQLGSMGALVRFCDIDSIAKGLNAPNKEEMSKYSTAAAIREEGDVAVKAQALTDQVSGRVKDLLMKPIGWSDMKIVGMSWGACQYQIEKTKGYAVGTEENLEAAGLLLNKVINESQDTSLASTKTGIARADSELIKGLAMFRSAPFKQFSRLTDAVGTLATLNARSKSGESISEEQMSAAKKELARTSAGWTMQAAVGIAISAMFAWLYKKDDDKNPLDYIVDFLSEMISVIPIVGDIYSYFADGYDVSYFAYDMLNDAMDNMKDTVSLVANGVSGKKVTRQQIAKAAYNDAVSIGEFTGIPVRNVKNFFAGITKRISSIFGGALGYSMDASMYEQSYQADLKEALESGNERLAEKVVELLYADKKSTSKLSESAATEVLRLYGAGYTAVLPPSIGNKITVDGVDYEVKAKDQKQIRQICDPADDAVIGLIASDIYKGLSDEEKAKAIGKMYTMYYARALNYVFGVPMSKTDALSYLGDAKTIISAAAHIQNLKADQDETGKTTVSRKSKVNDYIAELGVDEETAELILYAAGYSSDALMEAIANIAANAKLTDKQYTAVATALGIAD